MVYCEDAYDAMDGANALVLVTEWNQFRALDFSRAKELMADPLLVDLRNIYARGEPEAFGFRYSGIGRSNPPSPVDAPRAKAG